MKFNPKFVLVSAFQRHCEIFLQTIPRQSKLFRTKMWYLWMQIGWKLIRDLQFDSIRDFQYESKSKWLCSESDWKLGLDSLRLNQIDFQPISIERYWKLFFDWFWLAENCAESFQNFFENNLMPIQIYPEEVFNTARCINSRHWIRIPLDANRLEINRRPLCRMILKEVVNSIQSETSSTNRSRNDFVVSQIESLVWIHSD